MDFFAGVSPETIQAVQLAQAVLAPNQAMLEGTTSGRLEAVESRLSSPGSANPSHPLRDARPSESDQSGCQGRSAGHWEED